MDLRYQNIFIYSYTYRILKVKCIILIVNYQNIIGICIGYSNQHFFLVHN